VDDFERALEASRARQDYDAIIRGLDTIRAGLIHALARQNVCRFESAGCPFDPERHQVLAGDDPEPGTPIVEELRSGYEMGGAVLRKAWVRVG
jgi:molecular chaperone GrpE